MGDRATEMALKKPDHFVLKPQREGGGHNVYGADISEVRTYPTGQKMQLNFL